ncbi:glycosyltransferase family 2 protein [Pseudooceanicola onchidii]|uniref:glycosyltransferase family 2 protein n=1 Tax=Pseudooceanicola onchidii TaxID=2562279 RepID=UPI0010AB3635|nr:glycosyltransferase family A protein [Pseudooceanicola onchidii]
MTIPQVSVVIPCYNREGSVREAIESVLAQDFSDIEVIAVDDNSSDDTFTTLETISDPRFRAVRNPGPRGAASNRNHGASLACAPWIAFQDSDDVWLPGKLSKQMVQLKGSDFVAGYCGMLVKENADPGTPIIDRHPDPAIAPLSGHILPSLIRSSYLSTQILVIRRDVFEAVHGFDTNLPALEDWELMLRIAMEGPVAFLDEDLVIQRMSTNSITRSDRRRVAAQEMILERHRETITGFPGMLAFHHHRLAGGYRMLGDMTRAAAHARGAWAAAPGQPKYLVNMIRLSALALLWPGLGDKGEGGRS